MPLSITMNVSELDDWFDRIEALQERLESADFMSDMELTGDVHDHIAEQFAVDGMYDDGSGNRWPQTNPATKYGKMKLALKGHLDALRFDGVLQENAESADMSVQRTPGQARYSFRWERWKDGEDIAPIYQNEPFGVYKLVLTKPFRESTMKKILESLASELKD